MDLQTIVLLSVAAGVPIGAFCLILLFTRADRREAYEALKRLGVR